MTKSADDIRRAIFAKNLNRMLTEKGFNPKYEGRQTELANLFGGSLSPKTCRRWLEGTGLPSVKYMTLLAQELKIELSAFFSDESSASEQVTRAGQEDSKQAAKLIREIRALDRLEISPLAYKLLLSVIETIKKDTIATN